MTAETDPKGLIREAYRIEGIGGAECRSILLDWAVSLPNEVDVKAAVAAQYETYRQNHPEHPMTAVLREGLGAQPQPRRRGGGRVRRGASGDG